MVHNLRILILNLLKPQVVLHFPPIPSVWAGGSLVSIDGLSGSTRTGVGKDFSPEPSLLLSRGLMKPYNRSLLQDRDSQRGPGATPQHCQGFLLQFSLAFKQQPSHLLFISLTLHRLLSIMFDHPAVPLQIWNCIELITLFAMKAPEL